MDPWYAEPGRHVHISKKLNSVVFEEMLTFSSAHQMVKKVARQKHDHYVEMVEERISKVFTLLGVI